MPATPSPDKTHDRLKIGLTEVAYSRLVLLCWHEPILLLAKPSYSGEAPKTFFELAFAHKHCQTPCLTSSCMLPQCQTWHMLASGSAPASVAISNPAYQGQGLRQVSCADNNNGPGGWLRLFIEQSGGQAAVSSVQVRTSNSGAAWTSMRNVYGSDWEIGNSPSYPLDVSIIGPDGQTVRIPDPPAVRSISWHAE